MEIGRINKTNQTCKNTVIKGDRCFIEQVYFNMLLNAIDNTNKNGKILVLISVDPKGPIK